MAAKNEFKTSNGTSYTVSSFSSLENDNIKSNPSQPTDSPEPVSANPNFSEFNLQEPTKLEPFADQPLTPPPPPNRFNPADLPFMENTEVSNPQQPPRIPQPSQIPLELQRRQPMQPILRIKKLTKKYGDRVAVNNISLNVFPGQIVGFLGANGAGKSTTIKMLTGLAHITSGNAYICGYSVKTSFEQAIKRVGAMIEIPMFYPYLSGYNNLKFFSKLSGKVATERINYVASLVGLSNRIKDKVGNYSLGMKQRLGVAQALLHSPKLLILDEPTNGLDANGIREFRMMLKQLAYKEKISILISSHILGEMENLCDVVAIIDKGRIIEVKTLEEIKRSCMQAGSQYIKCNAPNYAGKLIIEKYNLKVMLQGNNVYFTANDNALLPQIIVTLTQNKILVYGAGDVDYSLEDVFLNIINKNSTSTSIN